MPSAVETTYEREGGKGGYVRGLVLDHLPLVAHVVHRICAGFTPSAPREDLISAGTLGLVEAAHRFDPTQGTKFKTYAYCRIRGAVMDFLRQKDPLSKAAREQVARVRHCIRKGQEQDGRRPTIEEIVKRTDMSEDDVVKCLSYEKWRHMESLDSTVDGKDGDGNPLAALLADGGRTPLEELEWEERIRRVAQAVESLSERERQVIVMYYYEDLFMSEMAQILNVTEGRVSQLHTRALYNLSRKLEGE